MKPTNLLTEACIKSVKPADKAYMKFDDRELAIDVNVDGTKAW
jgi:hypothetical protein